MASSVRRLIVVVALLIVGGSASVWPAQAKDPTASVTATYTLPSVPLATAQNAGLPNSIADDRGFLLGGTGSDLWHGPGDAANEFWMVTDRGPNGQIRVNDVNRRTFPVPPFTPHILQVRTESERIAVLKAIPIVGQSGKPVTGLSNLDKIDETPYDATAQTVLPFNPSGLDTEGLVRTRGGQFWLADEYSPSLLHVGTDGKVIARYVPEGIPLDGADYPVVAALPAIYGKRKINRGFEGLAISADERTLYLLLQSPLLNPDSRTGNASRNTRILAFDIRTLRPVAEYVYQFESVDGFDPKQAGKPDEMKLSGVVALSPTHLLVLERTDEVAKLYRVDLAAATNILGTPWSAPATAPTLESLANPSAAGVRVLPKTLVVDLSALPSMPGKIEGVAVLSPTTIAVANDNDFDIGTIDASGRNQGKGTPSQVLIVTLGTAMTALPGMPRTGQGGDAALMLGIAAVLALSVVILAGWRRVAGLQR